MAGEDYKQLETPDKGNGIIAAAAKRRKPHVPGIPQE
jgi:hypothetical protein